MKILTGSGAAFENGYLTQNDPDATKRLLRRVTKNKNIWRSVIDSPYKLYRAWRHITSASENANRVAIYHAARRSGKSLKQAVFEAKDVMDFSMGGDYPHIQFLIQTVPFLNARLQGNYRLAKAARENPASFTLRGMMIGLAGWILYMQFRDDERYKELEMWDKHAYHHFWIGADHYRLPKAFEVGAIFNTIPEMFTEQYLEDASDEEKELARGFAHILLQTFAFNPVPQTLMPLVELGFNYDTFRQRPIVSYYEQKRLPPEQFRYTTSPTMRELAKRLPRGMDTIGLGKLRSPMHLQQLWSNYTGTLGRYFLMAADSMVRSQADYPLPPSWETQDYPVLGSFARGANPARRTKYEREVYALLDRVTEIQGSLNLYEKINDVESWRQIRIEDAGYIKIADSLEEAREAIQDINNAIMRIHITDYDPETRKGWKPDEKQQKIDELEEMRNKIFRKAYELRPGGALNPEGDVGIATEEETESLIDRFGVDDSEAYLMRLKEEAPTTAELLQMVNENLSAANLQALARSNEAR
jgi:hypothetical protein